MARKTASLVPVPEAPVLSPEVGARRLRGLIERGRKLATPGTIPEIEMNAWWTALKADLEEALGRNQSAVFEVLHVSSQSVVFESEAQSARERAQTVIAQVRMLEEHATRLERRAAEQQMKLPLVSSPSAAQAQTTKSVFVVHGHDGAARESAVRFLEKLRLSPVVLHEQANKGRTVIEKFEDHSKDVSYAVILLTADDFGGAKGASASSPRARQNVIFELGFFTAKLGRHRTCALYEEGVDLPSDFSGVLYVALDRSEAWKLQLARELKAAGLPIDMNDVV